MKRFHVHVHVDDLQKNIAFYSAMFDAPPTKIEGDYAKWMLEGVRLAPCGDRSWCVRA